MPTTRIGAVTRYHSPRTQLPLPAASRRRYDRSRLALTLEPLYAAEAKRRLSPGTNQYTERSSQKSDETSHIRTDEQLAKLAGVSRDTIRKVSRASGVGASVFPPLGGKASLFAACWVTSVPAIGQGR